MRHSSYPKKLFIKPESYVTFDAAGNVKKRFSVAEKQAYEYLSRHRDLLVTKQLRITFPSIISYDSASKVATLTNIGKFPNTSPVQYNKQNDYYI